MTTYHVNELSYKVSSPVSMPLVYTNHALKALTSDRYGVIPVLDILPTETNVFSIDINYVPAIKNKDITKYCLRFNFNDELDIILVVVPCNNHYKVVTSWFNRSDDKHDTLDIERYKKARKPQLKK